MAQSQCLVTTENGSRYLQQLAKHWAHKFEVTFDATQAHIVMPEGRVIELTTTADTLTIHLTAPDDALPRLQEITDSHITRFAFREELVFDWQPA